MDVPLNTINTTPKSKNSIFDEFLKVETSIEKPNNFKLSNKFKSTPKNVLKNATFNTPTDTKTFTNTINRTPSTPGILKKINSPAISDKKVYIYFF